MHLTKTLTNNLVAFAFGGTEMVGLAAAETADPRKSVPTASKQVFWRIALFYIVNLFILGTILPSDDDRLLGASGANSKASPFVLAIKDAGIKVLPSIFNAVITISVLSVANTCTFGSTRTMQAMAMRGHAPKFLNYIDGKGRPIYCVIIQLAFGLLAYIGESPKGGTIFDWLLALSGLAFLFVWGTICLAHARMRSGFKAQGMNLDLVPYKTPFGVWGSYLGVFLNVIALVATFYSSLYVSSTRSFGIDDANIPLRLLMAPLLTPRPSSCLSSLVLSFLLCTWVTRCTLGTGSCMSGLLIWISRLASLCWMSLCLRSPRPGLLCLGAFCRLLSRLLAEFGFIYIV